MPATTPQKTNRRTVQMLSAAYFAETGQGSRALIAQRWEEIDLIPSEEKRLDELGALVPLGMSVEEARAATDAQLDTYRAARGDHDARARHEQRRVDAALAAARQGGIVNIDAPVRGSVTELADWIKNESTSVEDTIALAEGDAELAERVLEAETIAHGGKPRAAVDAALGSLLSGPPRK